MSTQEKMESKNIVIRTAVFDDCEYFVKWEQNPEVAKFFTIDDNQSYETVVRKFVLSEIDPHERQYTILLTESDEPIGRIYISRLDEEQGSMDITRIYIGDAKYRNKGYGREVLTVILERAFINWHLERVSLDHFADNKQGAHLYMSLGFKYEGVARNSGKKNGKYYDLHLMSMLRAEYLENLHEK